MGVQRLLRFAVPAVLVVTALTGCDSDGRHDLTTEQATAAVEKADATTRALTDAGYKPK